MVFSVEQNNDAPPVPVEYFSTFFFLLFNKFAFVCSLDDKNTVLKAVFIQVSCYFFKKCIPPGTKFSGLFFGPVCPGRDVAIKVESASNSVFIVCLFEYPIS
jgi:hypothetical protein